MGVEEHDGIKDDTLVVDDFDFNIETDLFSDFVDPSFIDDVACIIEENLAEERKNDKKQNKKQSLKQKKKKNKTPVKRRRHSYPIQSNTSSDVWEVSSDSSFFDVKQKNIAQHATRTQLNPVPSSSPVSSSFDIEYTENFEKLAQYMKQSEMSRMQLLHARKKVNMLSFQTSENAPSNNSQSPKNTLNNFQPRSSSDLTTQHTNQGMTSALSSFLKGSTSTLTNGLEHSRKLLQTYSINLHQRTL